MPMPMAEKHSSELYLMNKLLLHAAFFVIFGAQHGSALGAIYQDEKQIAVYA